jgi:hypothetical protein
MKGYYAIKQNTSQNQTVSLLEKKGNLKVSKETILL